MKRSEPATKTRHDDDRRLGRLRRGALALSFAAAAVAGVVAVPAAHADGVSYNNTDPYSTGCNAGASLIQTHYVGGGQLDMFYSGTCHTNWVQWTGPDVCTWKRVQSDYGSWTRWDNDKAPWSYSMQIYAPGASTVDVEYAVGSNAYGNGTCDGGAWDYAHDVGLHGTYSVT